MKQEGKRRAALLALLVAAALVLSSCYMTMTPPDLPGGSGDIAAGSSGVPFASVGQQLTPTPSPSPTPVSGGINQLPPDWGATGTGTSTQTAPPANNQPTSPLVPTTPPRTNTPAPTQDSSVLRSGSKGDAVKHLQSQLKELGYYTGGVDGEYGSGTTNAVKDFQQANGLKVDGVAGAGTLDKVYSYYAVPKSKSSNTNTNTGNKATATPKPTATPNLKNARFLKVGMSGTDVRQLQNRLIALGYLSGKADGSYGGATEAAVKAFQKQVKGLWEDGIAGPDTQTKLYASNAPKANGAAAAVGESLKEGMDGDAVRALQKRLIALGFLNGKADGDFGAATKAAVIAFQKKHGLTADGVAGTNTLNKLFADDASNANANTGNTGNTGNYTKLQEGDSGDAVKRLQQKLKELGYYTGTVDGKYGAGTVSAVQTFQSMSGLQVDGIAGPATQQRLYGDNASSNKITGSLKQYDEGSGVRDMQYALYELGYFQDAINGIYGASTANAVREFQMVNGLKVDGVAGNATLNLLFSASAKSASSPTGRYETLALGDEGEGVALLQVMLYDLGYMSESYTGVFDDATFVALKSFQQYNGLPVDGIAGALTQEKLYSDAAVPNPLRP